MPACSRDLIHQQQEKNEEGKNTDKTRQKERKERKKEKGVDLSTSTNISTELLVFSDLSRVTHHTRVSRAGHRSGAALLTHT